MGKMMTLDEKLATASKAFELLHAGDREGYTNMMRTAPMPPYLAKVFKEKIGAEKLREGGWNLVEADAEFGPGWLDK